MIDKWVISEHEGRRKGCVIGLPGRGIPVDVMDSLCHHMDLPNTLKISLQPIYLRWYPQPNGVEDQENAVSGMKEATAILSRKIRQVQRAFRLRRNQIALVGYSAGAVMALQMVACSEQPFAAVVSLAGAILEPEEYPIAKNQTPILLRHAVDDDCFSWEERYLPMRRTLLDNGYNLYTNEKQYGGHGLTVNDAEASGRFVGAHLGYKNNMTFNEEEVE